MTPVFNVINDCKSLGVTLNLKGQRLRVMKSKVCNANPQQLNCLLDVIGEHAQEIKEQLVALESRAAILEYDGGLTRPQAESQAFEELAAVGACHETGYRQVTKQGLQKQAERETPDQGQIKQWRGFILSLPRASNQEGARLVKYALAFLDSPLCLEAVSHGWDSLSLFGIFNGGYKAAQRRHDTMGLVPSLAWSKIRGNLSGITENIIRLDSEAAYLEMKAINDKSGTPRKRSRILTGASFAVPFWENQHFMGEI